MTGGHRSGSGFLETTTSYTYQRAQAWYRDHCPYELIVPMETSIQGDQIEPWKELSHQHPLDKSASVSPTEPMRRSFPFKNVELKHLTNKTVCVHLLFPSSTEPRFTYYFLLRHCFIWILSVIVKYVSSIFFLSKHLTYKNC